MHLSKKLCVSILTLPPLAQALATRSTGLTAVSESDSVPDPVIPAPAPLSATEETRACPSNCAVFSKQTGQTACDGQQRQRRDPRFSRLAFNCFIDQFYRQLNYTDSLLTFVDTNYIQHNPNIADGRAAVLQLFNSTQIQNQSSSNGSNPYYLAHVLWDNYTGVLHSRVSGPNGTYVAVADFWRMDGPCIVEHWDVIQPVPTNATANSHPMFSCSGTNCPT